jgi:hypothetical protein
MGQTYHDVAWEGQQEWSTRTTARPCLDPRPRAGASFRRDCASDCLWPAWVMEPSGAGASGGSGDDEVSDALTLGTIDLQPIDAWFLSGELNVLRSRDE